MPLFKSKENELQTKFDKWCYFLKNLESFDHIPAILNEPIFQKAFETSKIANLTPEQRNLYDENLIQYWGMKSAVDTAVEEREVAIAKNAILEGANNKFIAKITGLTVEEVEKLRTNIKK
jgi:DNA-binding NarL/FixJ family response regulator